MAFAIVVGDSGNEADADRTPGVEATAAAPAQFVLRICDGAGLQLSVGPASDGEDGSCVVEGGSTTLLAVLLGQAEVSWAIVSGHLAVHYACCIIAVVPIYTVYKLYI
jgi:hypothetical protein